MEPKSTQPIRRWLSRLGVFATLVLSSLGPQASGEAPRTVAERDHAATSPQSSVQSSVQSSPRNSPEGRELAQAFPAVLRVGIPGHFPPHYVVSPGREPSGFGVDLFEAVRKRADFEVRYVVFATWPEALRALEQRRIDVLADLGITADREALVHFTAPTDTLTVNILIRQGQREVIRGLDDLLGRTVSVVARNVGQRLLDGNPGVDLFVHPNRSEALIALLSGRSDALVYPGDVILRLAQDAGLEGRILALEPPLTEVKRAIGVRKDWPVVAARLDQALAQIIETPEYRAIYRKWHARPMSERGLWRRAFAAAGGALLALLGWTAWRWRRLVRIQSEAAAEHTRADELQRIIDSAPDAMLLVNEHGEIVLANERTEVLFGYSREALIGRVVEQLLPEEFRAGHVERRKQYWVFPHTRMMGVGLQLFGRRATGESFPVDINLSPIRLQGRTLTSAVVRDVSAHRELELELRAAKDEADRAAEGKLRFLAAASHDLRQPLQALGMYLSVLKQRLDSPAEAGVAAKMTVALDAMGGLLNTLLDMSKLDSGGITPEWSDVSLATCFSVVRDQASPLAEQRGLDLVVEPTSFWVRTDTTLLQRIIDNLVGNAIRYTDQGEVRVGACLEPEWLRVEVADTGIGIPTSQLDAIFEEYVQLNNPARDRTKGIGLGLSVVKRIARLLGYRLEVTSRVGEGSTFSVLIPVANLVAEDPTSSLGERPPPSPLPLVVLYIEDDPVVLDATSLLLESAGFDVRSGNRTDVALAQAVAGAIPDVILSDFRLPNGETGTELVMRVREQLGQDVPAIIMTGDTSHQQIEASNVANCKILHKPADGDELIGLIHRLGKA